MKLFAQLINKLKGKKNSRKKKEYNTEQYNNLKNMISRLEKKVMKSTDKKDKITYIINIDNLYLYNPELNKIEFRLDNLDVKELSGSLNMGNNFIRHSDSKAKSKLSGSESKGKIANVKILRNHVEDDING